MIQVMDLSLWDITQFVVLEDIMRDQDEFRWKQILLCKSAAQDEINKESSRKVKFTFLDIGGY